MIEKLTAKEALKAELDAIKSLRGDASMIDAAIGRNILREDLGEYKTDWLASYSLDEHTRDRLIAHARQDAAHAVLIASRIRGEVKTLLWWVKFSGVMLTVIFILLVSKFSSTPLHLPFS